LLSPALHRAGDADLDAWAASVKPLLVLVPELDDYLRPDEARQRFARVPQAVVIGVDGAKHLWVGENYVRIALSEIAATFPAGRETGAGATGALSTAGLAGGAATVASIGGSWIPSWPPSSCRTW